MLFNYCSIEDMLGFLFFFFSILSLKLFAKKYMNSIIYYSKLKSYIQLWNTRRIIVEAKEMNNYVEGISM